MGSEVESCVNIASLREEWLVGQIPGSTFLVSLASPIGRMWNDSLILPALGLRRGEGIPDRWERVGRVWDKEWSDISRVH